LFFLEKRTAKKFRKVDAKKDLKKWMQKLNGMGW